MSKFIKNLSMFFAGLPLLLSKVTDAAEPTKELFVDPNTDHKAVSLRALNFDINNLFAGHRSHSSHSSHSSHRSHSSHYSGTSGSTYTPAPRTPAPITPAPIPAETSSKPTGPTSTSNSHTDNTSSTSPRSNTGTSEDIAGTENGNAKSSPSTSQPASGMSTAEKLKLQIFRVQIKLNSLQLYDGQINGIMNKETQKALKQYQAVKGLLVTGTMTTETMNALGIAI